MRSDSSPSLVYRVKSTVKAMTIAYMRVTTSCTV